MARIYLFERSLNMKSNESAAVKRTGASEPPRFHLVLFQDDLTISGFTYLLSWEIGVVYYGRNRL